MSEVPIHVDLKPTVNLPTEANDGPHPPCPRHHQNLESGPNYDGALLNSEQLLYSPALISGEEGGGANVKRQGQTSGP